MSEGFVNEGTFQPSPRSDLKLHHRGLQLMAAPWVTKEIHDDPRKFFEGMSDGSGIHCVHLFLVDTSPCYLNLVGTSRDSNYNIL